MQLAFQGVRLGCIETGILDLIYKLYNTGSSYEMRVGSACKRRADLLLDIVNASQIDLDVILRNGNIDR